MERGNTPGGEGPDPTPTPEPGPGTTAPRGLLPEDRGPVDEPGGSPIHTDPSDLEWKRIPREVTGPGIDPNEDVGDEAFDENGGRWLRERHVDGSVTSSTETEFGDYSETVDRDGNRTRSLDADDRGWREAPDGGLEEWQELQYDNRVQRRTVNPDGSRTELPLEGDPRQ